MKTPANKPNPQSIRSKLWQGIGLMAGLNFTVGAASYSVAAGLTNDQLISVGIAFVSTAAITIAVGRWFADQVASPIAAANLAAKSSERNPSESLPSATGAAETDEIVLSIHRSNRQLLAYASLMESAASGNTANAVMPLDSPDRLTAAFQKLVQRVAESVNAKRELEDLRLSLKDIDDQLDGLLERWPNVEIRGSQHVARIADSINELASRTERGLSETKGQISGTESILLSANLTLRNGLVAGEAAMQTLSRAVSALKGMPDHVKTIAGICEPANSAAEKATLSFRDGIDAGQTLAAKIALIQRHQNELNRKMRKLRDRSQSIAEAASSVEDLARRSNLLALNTSIQADNRSDSAALGNEFRSLSDRAQRAQKEISNIERSLNQEIDDTDTIVRFLLAESADAGFQLATLLELVENFEPVLGGLFGVPERIRELVIQSASGREELTRAITACYFDLEKIPPQLRETEHSISTVRKVIEEVSAAFDRKESPNSEHFDSPSVAGNSPLELSGEI